MSKLVDKLKQISRGAVPPMGFRPASSLPQSPSMLLIANLTQVSTEAARLVAGAGVDAALVSRKLLGSRDVKRVVTALGDVPLGVAVGGVNPEDVTEIAKLGYDFIVFSLKTPLEILEVENMGKILEIKPSLDSGLVKAISNLPLPVDGVLIGGDEPCITVEHLLVCQRFADLLDKPVLVSVPPSVLSNQLGNLWEIGIDGVIVSGELPKEKLAELKKAVGNLPRRTKPRGKVSPIVPPSAGGTGVEVEEEGEEEEEEI